MASDFVYFSLCILVVSLASSGSRICIRSWLLHSASHSAFYRRTERQKLLARGIHEEGGSRPVGSGWKSRGNTTRVALVLSSSGNSKPFTPSNGNIRGALEHSKASAWRSSRQVWVRTLEGSLGWLWSLVWVRGLLHAGILGSARHQ